MLNNQSEVRECLINLNKANIEQLGSINTTANALCQNVGLCQISDINLNEDDSFINLPESSSTLGIIKPIPEISAKERKEIEWEKQTNELIKIEKTESKEKLIQISPNKTSTNARNNGKSSTNPIDN